MKRKLITIIGTLLLVCSLFCGCADKNSVQENGINEEIPASESSVDSEIEGTSVQNEIVTEEEKAALTQQLNAILADMQKTEAKLREKEAEIDAIET